MKEGRTHDSSIERCLEFAARMYSEHDKAYIAGVDFERMVVPLDNLPENIFPKIAHAVTVLRRRTEREGIIFYDYNGKTYQLEMDEVLNSYAILKVEKKQI